MKQVAMLVVLLAFSSCHDDNGVDGGHGTNPFSFMLEVRDVDGRPVAGLRTGVWNTTASVAGAGAPASLSSTTFGFALPMAARVSFDILDLNHVVDTVLLEDVLLQAGYYRLTGSLFRNYGTRVWECRMTARNAGGDSLLFQDRVSALLWQPDAGIAFLGGTDAAGRLQTGDSLQFPHVLSLPAIVHTSADGPDSLGLVTLSDSVAIALTDTSTGQRQITVRRIVKGANSVTIVWNPPASGRRQPRLDPGLPGFTHSKSGIPDTWELDPPFPNPFN